jgi:hypothetical protein
MRPLFGLKFLEPGSAWVNEAFDLRFLEPEDLCDERVAASVRDEEDLCNVRVLSVPE